MTPRTVTPAHIHVPRDADTRKDTQLQIMMFPSFLHMELTISHLAKKGSMKFWQQRINESLCTAWVSCSFVRQQFPSTVTTQAELLALISVEPLLSRKENREQSIDKWL